MLQLSSRGDMFFAGLTIVGNKNRDIDVLVDTGASETLVDNDTCIDLGLTLDGFRERSCIHGDSKPCPLYKG